MRVTAATLVRVALALGTAMCASAAPLPVDEQLLDLSRRGVVDTGGGLNFQHGRPAQLPPGAQATTLGPVISVPADSTVYGSPTAAPTSTPAWSAAPTTPALPSSTSVGWSSLAPGHPGHSSKSVDPSTSSRHDAGRKAPTPTATTAAKPPPGVAPTPPPPFSIPAFLTSLADATPLP